MKACCWCWSLPFLLVVNAKGAVGIFKHSLAILSSKSSFKWLIFTFLKQLKTSLQRISIPPQSYRFAVTLPASHSDTYLSTMCEKMTSNLRTLTRQMADCFIVLCKFQGLASMHLCISFQKPSCSILKWYTTVILRKKSHRERILFFYSKLQKNRHDK